MVLVLQVRDSRVDHQVNQVQQIIPQVPQLLERFHNFLLEFLVDLAFEWAAQSLEHAVVDSNLRGEFVLQWRLFAEDKPEVDVEEFSFIVDHEVFQVSVSDSQEVSGDTVASAWADEIGKESLLVILIAFCELSEVWLNFFIFFDNICHCFWVWNKLQQSIINGKCNKIVESEFSILVCILESFVHDTKKLKAKLVLSHVITCFKHHHKDIFFELSVNLKSVLKR